MISDTLGEKTIQLQSWVNFLWKPLNTFYTFVLFNANLFKYMQWCFVVVSDQDLLFFIDFEF